MAKREPFIWQEIEHWTSHDVMDTLLLLGDQDEADSFLSAYAAVCEDDDHALHNVRWFAQVVGGDDGSHICDMFGVEIGPNEVISPRQTFAMSSCGVKVAS